MRIGLVIYGSLNTVSGGYLYDRKLVDTLEANGDEVIILSQRWRSYPQRLSDNWDTGFVRRAAREKLDLLLQDELNHPSLVRQNGRLRNVLGIPLISIVHHLRSDEQRSAALNRLYRSVERRYLNSVDGFIFNSCTTRQRVEALLERPQPSIVVLPAADHLVPPERAAVEALIDQRANSDGPLRVLAAGSVSQRKNLHVVLRALAKLPAGSWTLNIAGDVDTEPAYVEQLRKLALELNINDDVDLMGAVESSTLRQLYAASHVLALPSYEGFGIVYLEAMSFGVVPIAATVGAAHEIVDEGRTGYLVDPDDAATLATRLLAMHRGRETWRNYALAARARYDRHPPWRESMQNAHAWLHEFEPSNKEAT